MKKLLIASPIKQRNEVLRLFLKSIRRQEIESDYEVHYYFIDDNDDAESKKELEVFKSDLENVYIRLGDFEIEQQYVTNEYTHYWTNSLVWKVAKYKNAILKFALDNNFEYVFLIDSDILMHPKTIGNLISKKKEVISEIFWTKWTPTSIELPQVWCHDHYTQFEIGELESLEQLSENEVSRRTYGFINKLRKPGVYEVGGLGACTLIHKTAIEKGVNFDKVKNITFWGEDRHFCIRASVLGVELYVDTNYPAFHIYRESDFLNGLIYLDDTKPLTN